MHGRLNASFEDVQELAAPVLQHRIGLSYRAKVDGMSASDFVAQLLEAVPPEGSELPKLLEEAGA